MPSRCPVKVDWLLWPPNTMKRWRQRTKSHCSHLLFQLTHSSVQQCSSPLFNLNVRQSVGNSREVWSRSNSQIIGTHRRTDWLYVTHVKHIWLDKLFGILQFLRRKPLLCAAWLRFLEKHQQACLWEGTQEWMAIFVSVRNYLFTGMIALLSSSPPSLIELCISREERNALIQKLLFGDCLNVRIADCRVAVIRVAASVWEVDLKASPVFMGVICFELCFWSVQLHLRHEISGVCFKAPSPSVSFHLRLSPVLPARLPPLLEAGALVGLSPITWSPLLLFPVSAIWYPSHAAQWANTCFVPFCLCSFYLSSPSSSHFALYQVWMLIWTTSLMLGIFFWYWESIDKFSLALLT